MDNHELILIIDANESYAKELSRFAAAQGGFYDSAYASDGEEGFRLFTVLRPDVIILDAIMPVLDGMGFLRKLNAAALPKKPVIIMSTQTPLTNLLETAARYGVDYFMIKPQSHKNVCEAARDLLTGARAAAADNAAAELEKTVTQYLRSLGMPAHLDGYRYMRSAMIMMLDDPELISPITKRLYPMIAQKYNTTNCCVERALRHAIGVSWQRGSRRLLSDIFGYTSEDVSYRPTNAEYIAMVSDDFRMKFKYDML